jgi:hypothetical protein
MMRLKKIEPAQIAEAMRTVRAGLVAGTRTSWSAHLNMLIC